MKVKVATVVDTYKSTLIAFFENIFTLKNLYRQGWVRYYGVAEEYTESVADHSFSVATLSYLFAKEYFPDLDADKVLKLALFHDIGEVHAGDIPLSSIKTQADRDAKHNKEQESVQRVFAPLYHGKEMVALWEEFESGKSKEAQFVKEIDKLEFLLQALLYQKSNVIDIDFDAVLARSNQFFTHEILKAVVKEIREHSQ